MLVGLESLVHEVLTGRFVEQSLHAISIAAPRFESRAVLEHDVVLAAEQGTQLFDSLNIDHSRAVDAQKSFRIQFLLEVIHRFPQEM